MARRSIGRPSASEAICRHTVSRPCPTLAEPTNTDTWPCSSTTMRGRAVEDGEALHRQAERVGGDLQAHGLEALPDARRADEYRHLALLVDDDACALARAGRAAFDEAGDADAGIAAVDETALDALFFFLSGSVLR